MARVAMLLWLAGVLLPARAAAQPAVGAAADGDAGDAVGVSAPASGDDGALVPPRTSVTAHGLPTVAEGHPSAIPTRRYGLQILAVDAASFAAAMALRNGDVFVAGWLFGAPVVHVAHGNALRALGSLALRVGLPLTGALVGATLSCGTGGGEFCGFGGLLLGGGLGMIAATSIDAALAREAAPVPSQPVARFVPQLQVGTGRVTVGVAGLL